MPEDSFKTNPQVVATPFDNGEGVLIDLQGKQYFQLNETGLFIWQRLADGHSSAQIVAALMTEYEVSEAQAQASVQRLLADLQQRELLSE
jgi:Coenzyme PQQ synthesis protein D (PqqD)